MTREQLLTILGILVLVSPWSGLPLAYLEWVLLVLGLAIVAIAVTRPRNSIVPPLPLHNSQPAEPTQASSEPSPRSSHIAFS